MGYSIHAWRPSNHLTSLSYANSRDPGQKTKTRRLWRFTESDCMECKRMRTASFKAALQGRQKMPDCAIVNVGPLISGPLERSEFLVYPLSLRHSGLRDGVAGTAFKTLGNSLPET
jgi:hypothetical protein